jgi:ferredoxin
MKTIYEEIKGLGFDSARALSANEALAAHIRWLTHVDGRTVPNVTLPSEADIRAELSGHPSILMLATTFQTVEGYLPGVAPVSAYYAASYRAQKALQALIALLEARGIHTTVPALLRLKPLARAAGFGDYGKNGVIVRKGEHITINALLLDVAPEALGELTTADAEPMPCLTCGLCEKACPTGALKGGEVDTARCLRPYMAGPVLPKELEPFMGERVLGCDTCLNACPNKSHIPMPTEWADWFNWDTLLDEERYEANRPAIETTFAPRDVNAIRVAALRRADRVKVNAL